MQNWIFQNIYEHSGTGILGDLCYDGSDLDYDGDCVCWKVLVEVRESKGRGVR